MPYADPEKRKDYQKKYREENRAKQSEYMKKYYQENKEEIRAKQSEYMKEYYQKNKEEINNRTKKYHQTDAWKDYFKVYYENNREEILTNRKEQYHNDPTIRQKHKEVLQKQRQHRRDWLNQLKAKSQCKYCQESYPACLDFHHRDPNQKEGLISKMVGSAVSMKRIMEEIAKCDIVCSNCHRKIHSGALLQEF